MADAFAVDVMINVAVSMMVVAVAAIIVGVKVRAMVIGIVVTTAIFAMKCLSMTISRRHVAGQSLSISRALEL